MRQMSMQELIAFAYQMGIDVRQAQMERGKLLTEILKHTYE